MSSAEATVDTGKAAITKEDAAVSRAAAAAEAAKAKLARKQQVEMSKQLARQNAREAVPCPEVCWTLQLPGKRVVVVVGRYDSSGDGTFTFGGAVFHSRCRSRTTVAAIKVGGVTLRAKASKKAEIHKFTRARFEECRHTATWRYILRPVVRPAPAEKWGNQADFIQYLKQHIFSVEEDGKVTMTVRGPRSSKAAGSAVVDAAFEKKFQCPDSGLCYYSEVDVAEEAA